MALKTLVLGPGDCAVLPATVSIISIAANGAISATSSCGELPPIDTYKCWRFRWQYDSGDTSFNDAYFSQIKIGDTYYDLTSAPVSETNSYDNGGNFLEQALPLATPTGLISSITNAGGTAVNPKCVIINIPSTLGQPILYFKDPISGGTQQEFAIFGEDECSC